MGLVSRTENASKALQRKQGRFASTKFVDSKIESTEETQTFLKRFPIELQHQVIREALRKAAKVAGDRMKGTAPVDKGDLKRSPRIKVTVHDESSVVFAVVGPKYPEGGMVNLIEFGSSRQPPQPFLRRSADETKAAQQLALTKHIRDRWETI